MLQLPSNDPHWSTCPRRLNVTHHLSETRDPGSMLPTTHGGFRGTVFTNRSSLPLDQCHFSRRACTLISSSSSLCLRDLYRNMPRLLRASPGTNRSRRSFFPPRAPEDHPQDKNRCTSLRLAEEDFSSSPEDVSKSAAAPATRQIDPS